MRRFRRYCPFFLLLALLSPGLPAQEDWSGRSAVEVEIRMSKVDDPRILDRLRPLLSIQTGDAYQYRLVRQSIENLYLSGILDNVRVEIAGVGEKGFRIAFVCQAKLSVRGVKIVKNDHLLSGEVRSALLVIRRNSFLDQRALQEAELQLRRLYEGEGYLNPKIDFRIRPVRRKRLCDVHVTIRSGVRTRIGRLELVCERPDLKRKLQRALNLIFYQPKLINERLDKIRQQLRKQHYFFPEIEVKPVFTGMGRSLADLKVVLDPGLLYRFHFEGMGNRFKLIQSVWTTKVFESWAEKESKSRLMLYLKNKGHQNARISSRIDESREGEKVITFTAEKGPRYRLGRIEISGASGISSREVSALLSVDDNWFNRFLWLQATPVLVDQEMVRLYYYQQGYPDARVTVETTFRDGKADLHFRITPGKRVTVRSIRWQGNAHFDEQTLRRLLKTSVGEAFVEHRFSEDMERLRQFYIARGYFKVRIEPRLTGAEEKEIGVHIVEGKSYRLGELIVIGASSFQERWLRKMFPVRPGEAYDTTRVNLFLEEIEQLGSFSNVRLKTMEAEDDRYNVLLTIVPDKSRFYGFGLGWEERKGVSNMFEGIRGLVEFQGRNIFSSYSSLSGILQAGLNETRLVISLDTPNLLGTKLNSSFKLWREKETFTSYTFERIGIGPTLVKRTGPSSFISASLNWYRTELTKLDIRENPTDRLHDPFDTMAFNFAFVTDKRDDPFNPTRGDFFSTDLKVGLPFFWDHDSFFRFMWRYQKNLQIAKTLSLSLSVRNGFAAGDMSITERFFAGGINSFRGTRLDKLGPMECVVGEDGKTSSVPTGGEGMFLFNAEATFPLVFFPSNEWFGSVFIDIGNVYSRAGDINLKKVERALGFGIKYRTPLGPLRIDFSWNLRAKADYGFIFHFGIGNAF